MTALPTNSGKDTGSGSPIIPRRPDRAEGHHGKTHGTDTINDAHGPVHDDHRLGLHDLRDLPAEPGCVPEEDRANNIHQGGKEISQTARVIEIQEFNMDVAESPDRHAAAEKGYARQKISGNFLG